MVLTLQSGSACDVCAEEYGPQSQPHSIPCGHVLCASCCGTIIDKTPPRLSPACPFCRENFSGESVRAIRLDFATSGWTTPRRVPPSLESNHAAFADLWTKKTERLLASQPTFPRQRLEVRRLEDKVAKVASKRCSVEEVTALHRELEDWLATDTKEDNISLHLSTALLRAILMNHLAHSEASKNAKSLEDSLKNKIDDLELELPKLRAQYHQKSQDYQSVWSELNRLKASMGMPADTQQNTTSSPSSPSNPVPPPQNPLNPVSRFTSLHSRSASMSSRPSTPATTSPTRSHTPASPLRGQTPAPALARTQTPSPHVARSHTPSVRSHTPAPPYMRHATPAPLSPLRTTTPAPPPLVPPKPRRLSTPSPQKMSRSTSEEKAEVHERWIPPLASNDVSGKSYRYVARSPSRMAYTSTAAIGRYREASATPLSS